jgi:hypothetical protein
MHALLLASAVALTGGVVSPARTCATGTCGAVTYTQAPAAPAVVYYTQPAVQTVQTYSTPTYTYAPSGVATYAQPAVTNTAPRYVYYYPQQNTVPSYMVAGSCPNGTCPRR